MAIQLILIDWDKMVYTISTSLSSMRYCNKNDRGCQREQCFKALNTLKCLIVGGHFRFCRKKMSKNDHIWTQNERYWKSTTNEECQWYFWTQFPKRNTLSYIIPPSGGLKRIFIRPPILLDPLLLGIWEYLTRLLNRQNAGQEEE